MKELLKAAVFALGVMLLALTVTSTIARDFDQADTVRLVSVPAAGADHVCSAVVVAPGEARTARHCLKLDLHVDGKPVERASVPVASSAGDYATLLVPGLECPCATVVEMLPGKGEKIVAVGFSEVGKREVLESTVVAVGKLGDHYPQMARYNDPIVYVLAEPATLLDGMSGGGAFVLRGGKWVLVALNAIGVPERPAPPWVDVPEVASGFSPFKRAE